jgi:hypothetical protein
MEKKKQMEDETRRLTVAVICMSMVVLVIYGLGPSI